MNNRIHLSRATSGQLLHFSIFYSRASFFSWKHVNVGQSLSDKELIPYEMAS